MKCYLRFGNLPTGNISKQYKSGEIIKEEKGLSVWDCTFVNDIPFPLLPENATEACMADYFYLFLSDRPVYLVTGTELEQKGSVGEPLLVAPITFIRNYTDDYRYLKSIHSQNKTLEQAPCEDCVSKINVKEQMLKYGFHAPDMTVTEFVEDCLLPVTPKQKVGHWIDRGICEPWYRCSECGRLGWSKESYCPSCGVKMRSNDK